MRKYLNSYLVLFHPILNYHVTCRVLVEDLDSAVDLEVLAAVHLLVQASLRFVPS